MRAIDGPWPADPRDRVPPPDLKLGTAVDAELLAGRDQRSGDGRRGFRYVFSIDATQLLAWASYGFESLTAHSVAGVNDAGGFLSIVYPPDRPVVLERIHALANGRKSVDEYRVVTADGDVRWLRDEAAPAQRFSRDAPHASARAEDITERKRAERQLRRSGDLLSSVLDSIPDAVYVKDVSGMYLLVNAAGAASLGMTPDEMAMRRDRHIFPEDWERLREQDRRVMESRESLTFETVLPVAEGKRDFLVTKVPYRDDEGRVIGVVGVSRDVSELKGAYAERQRLLERVIRAEEDERRRIADDLHDDSVQVLTALALRLDLLRQMVSDGPAGELAEQISEATRLAIARIRRLMFNLYPPSLGTLGLRPAVQQLLEGVEADTGLGWTLDCDGEPHLPHHPGGRDERVQARWGNSHQGRAGRRRRFGPRHGVRRWTRLRCLGCSRGDRRPLRAHRDARTCDVGRWRMSGRVLPGRGDRRELPAPRARSSARYAGGVAWDAMTPKDEMIERSWDVLAQTFENVSDDALSMPGEDAGWAAKDHLGHISAWEGKMLAILEDRPVPDGLGIDADTYEREDIDGINAAIFERTRDLPAEDVVENLRTTHARLMAAVARTGDDDLDRPYVPEDSTDTRRLAYGVVGNTYKHYEEHLPHLQQLLGSR